MSTQPLSLQDSIAAWLQATRAQESVTPDFSVTTTPAEGLVNMAKPSQPKVDWTAMALQAAGNVKANADIQASLQAQQMAQATPWMNMGLRVAGTVGGGIAGIPLGPVGMAAGAATGAALMSNEVVQPREVAQGTREGVNPLVGMMEGYAAMPSGPALGGGALLPQLPRVAAGNFGLGVAGDALVQTAETGTVDPMRALQAGGMSAALGVAAPVAGRALMAAPRVATRVAQSPAVQRLMADETGAIRVHHASPHKFDKFDLSKVGTGEGAQAFGHGLYFAQNKDTANWYLKTFKEQHGKASLYEADINVDESQLVDWDKPMADQSPEIAAATRRVLDSRYGEGVFDEWSSNGADYKDLLDNFDDIDGPELSKLLKEAGVPGIKYLDRDSRYGGSDTRNIVVFDDSLVSVLSRSDFPIGRAVVPLNKDLQGAKPRFNIGTASFQPEFASPVDLAAYIVTQKNPSKRDADYLAYAMQQTGLDADGVRALGQQVRAAVKAQAKQAEGGTQQAPAALRVAQVWQEAATPSPRQPYAPERPLDPTNLPETIEPRRDLQPAQVQEDIERSFRYHTEIIGMEPTLAREMAEATATPEAWQRRQRIMPLSEQQAKANVIDALDLPTAKGTTLNAPQQLALADTFRAVSDQVANLNTKIGGSMAALEQGVLSGAPDAIAKMQAVAADLGVQGLDGIKRARLEAYDLLHRLNLQSEAVRSEWGRAGRAMQVEAKSRKLDDAAFLKRAYEMGAPTDEALDALDALRGNPEGQRQYLIDLYKPSGQEYWKAYLANNMLSGVPTLGVNLVSNTTNLVRKEVARLQVAGVERAAGVASREVAIPPARLMAQSYADGMRHAGKAFMSAMWDGRTVMDDNIAINVTETFRGHWLAKALEKSGMEQELSAKLGKLAANKWKRILVGTDAAFQMMAIYPEAYRRATADGINQGLTGPALADHILARVKDFDYRADASGAVRDYAKKTTFADEFGPVASAFQKFVNSVDGGTVRIADKMHAVRTGQVVGKDFASGSKMKLVQYPLGFAHFPFVRIGATLWKQAVGLLTDVPRAGYNLATGQGDRAQNLQRLVESANAYMLMGTFAALYEAGAIDFTTRAPENTFEREQFYGPEGKLPWAVGLGGRYIPMASFGPLGSAMAPVAAYLKGVSKDDDQTRAQRFAEATAAVAKMHLDGTLVRTAMSTFEGLTDDNKTGRLFGNYIAQNIPEGAFLRNVRDVTDPTLRDPETFVEEAKAQLPGLATTVRPRLNVWGQDIQKQGVGKRVYGSTQQGDGDYVGSELIKLKDSLPDLGRLDEGVYPPDLKIAAGAFEKSLESAMNKGVTRTEDGIKVRFTDADRQRYMRLVGESIHDVLSSAIAPDAGWEELDSTQKRDLVKKLKRMGKEMGEDLFMAEWEMPQ